MPGNGPVHWTVRHTEDIMEVMGDQWEGRKFDTQKYSHPATQAAKQTKPNGSGQIMQMLIMLIQTWQIISCQAPTEQQTKGKGGY